MDTFFFIAKLNNTLVKIYFSGLVTFKHVDYELILNDIYNKVNNKVDGIKDIYRHRVNKEGIFFIGQINQKIYVDSVNNNSISYDEYDMAFKHSNIFFSKSKYDKLDMEQFSQYNQIMEPHIFVDNIDIGVDECLTYLHFIETNYTIKISSDFELLTQKNKMLTNPVSDSKHLQSIIRTVKEREKTEFMLFELDIDITNSLINLYKLKYVDIVHNSIVDLNNTYNELWTNINNLREQFKSLKT